MSNDVDQHTQLRIVEVPHGTSSAADFQIGYIRGRVETLEKKLDKYIERHHQRIDELNDKIDEMSSSLRTSISQNETKLKTAEIVLGVAKWMFAAILLVLTLQFGDLIQLFKG